MDLAGQEVKDPDTGEKLPLASPILSAKDRLQKPKWHQVQSLEWGLRKLGPQLIVKDMRSEHHGAPTSLDTVQPEEGYAHIYFLPSGYVERAYLHIYYLKDDKIDESKAPWTVVTHPYQGEASVRSGFEAIDLANLQEEGAASEN